MGFHFLPDYAELSITFIGTLKPNFTTWFPRAVDPRTSRDSRDLVFLAAGSGGLGLTDREKMAALASRSHIIRSELLRTILTLDEAKARRRLSEPASAHAHFTAQHPKLARFESFGGWFPG